MGKERSICKLLKIRILASWALLLTLIVLFLSTASLATEYKVVKAEEILEQIGNGEDVNLTNCRIVGELDVSKIKLKTAPNLYFYELLSKGVDKDILISMGCNENLSVIDSNIKIKNSVFENGLYFSNVLFKNSTNFGGAIFNDSINFSGGNFKNYADFENTSFYRPANFKCVNFSSDADFSKVSFNSPAHFIGANFNCPTYFGWANFNHSANFTGATFNSHADFMFVTFNSHAYFSWADFNNGIANFLEVDFKGPAYFGWANFNTSKAVFTGSSFYEAAYFERAKFNRSASFFYATFNDISDFNLANFNDATDFLNATFNSTSDFLGPTNSENIITDAKNNKIFMKYYSNEAQYTDAANIYYNSRKRAQEDKNLTDLSKLKDILSWVVWGYGTKPVNTVYTAIFLIIVFAIIYRNPGVSLADEEGVKTFPRLYWRRPGIYRKNEPEENESEENSNISSWEFLYFSINIFTRLGPADWQQRDSFRKWVTLEGFMGWIILALFLATLTRKVWE